MQPKLLYNSYITPLVIAHTLNYEFYFAFLFCFVHYNAFAQYMVSVVCTQQPT